MFKAQIKVQMSVGYRTRVESTEHQSATAGTRWQPSNLHKQTDNSHVNDTINSNSVIINLSARPQIEWVFLLTRTKRYNLPTCWCSLTPSCGAGIYGKSSTTTETLLPILWSHLIWQSEDQRTVYRSDHFEKLLEDPSSPNIFRLYNTMKLIKNEIRRSAHTRIIKNKRSCHKKKKKEPKSYLIRVNLFLDESTDENEVHRF